MTGPEEERVRRGRPPWWLVAVFVAVAAVVVVGLAATGYRGERSSATTTTTRPPDVAAIAGRADAIVVGDVASLRRLGDPSDPAVVATIDVQRSITPAGPAPVTVYDKGFRESWQRGQRVLLFLRRPTGAAAAQARWRVQQRFRFDRGKLLAPFTVDDVLVALRRS